MPARTDAIGLKIARVRFAGLAGVFGLCVAFFAVRSPGFVSLGNLNSILQFSTLLILVTFGQTLVILGGGGGIDLSAGGIVSLTGLAIGFALHQGASAAVAAGLGIVLGTLLGLINGVLVARLKLLPLITTLGTFYAYNGLAVALTEGAPISGLPSGFGRLGQESLAGVPLHTWFVVLPVFVILRFTLTQMPIGRWLYAIGNNERACRLLGLPVDGIRLWLYALSGTLAALAGLVADSWLLSARPNIGENLELLSLTAALLGGTSIFGGVASLTGSLMAALFFTTLQTGLQMVNVNAIWQLGTVGLFLILSVWLDRVLKGVVNL